MSVRPSSPPSPHANALSPPGIPTSSTIWPPGATRHTAAPSAFAAQTYPSASSAQPSGAKLTAESIVAVSAGSGAAWTCAHTCRSVSEPSGWILKAVRRAANVSTRELLVEEGGFVYDSEAYNDDLPYWTAVNGQPHIVVPYTLVVNDARFVLGTGYGSPEHFLEYAKAELNQLRNDGDDVNRMMSIGLHSRFSGRPSRSDGLVRFIDYAQGLGDVWFARRIDIATTFANQYPAEKALAEAGASSR